MRVLAACALLSCSAASALAAPPVAELVEVQKLAADAPHSAFTDLILWRDQFICAFRQGRGHVSSDGRIAVMSSPDGAQWSKIAELQVDGLDLRDASLSETPDGRLMLIGGAAPRKADDESAPTGTFVAFSDDGSRWTEPRVVVKPGRWLWRTTWHKGKAYGISYAAPDDRPFTSLLVSDDGEEFVEAAPRLLDAGYPTEAAIRFADDETAYCLQRRDGAAPHDSAFLGVSRPPYTQWQWHDLGLYFGGPNLMETPAGQWIAAGRIQRDGRPTTDLAYLDVQRHTLTPILTLPSGGDTSYPGLAWKDDLLWVSYYSSHEGKTCVYLAKVRLTPDRP